MQAMTKQEELEQARFILEIRRKEYSTAYQYYDQARRRVRELEKTALEEIVKQCVK